MFKNLIKDNFLLGIFHFVLQIIFFSASSFCLVFSNKILILGGLPWLTCNYVYINTYSNTIFSFFSTAMSIFS